MANQGIIHLAHSVGGKPFCNTRRSHMSTTIEASEKWPVICQKCSAILAKWRAKRPPQETSAEDAA